jgi:Tfp pilus assembly protein PilN
MVTINLFPWRQRQQIYQQRMLKKIIGVAFLLTTVANIILYGALLHKENHARLRLAAIKRELKRYAALQARIAVKTNFAAPISMTKELIEEQETIKTFFARMGEAYAAEVCFTSLAREQNKMTFVGRARSPSDMSQFFQEWQNTRLFPEMQIEKLEQRHDALKFRWQGIFHAL